jgi:hypothetical protein
MALALCNVQGELHPLEEGLHALGSGLSQREYAAKVGKGASTIQHRMQAAALAAECTHMGADLRDGWRCLSELHSAPRWLWKPLVHGLAGLKLSAPIGVFFFRNFPKPVPAKGGGVPNPQKPKGRSDPRKPPQPLLRRGPSSNGTILLGKAERTADQQQPDATCQRTGRGSAASPRRKAGASSAWPRSSGACAVAARSARGRSMLRRGLKDVIDAATHGAVRTSVGTERPSNTF